MKNDLTCGVVRDLLPSYVEGLTSPESNTAVERHLSECPDCAQLRTALAGAPKQAAPEDAKEVDYLKKVKRRGWRRVAAAVAVTVLLFTAGVAAKLFVIRGACQLGLPGESQLDGSHKCAGTVGSAFLFRMVCHCLQSLDGGKQKRHRSCQRKADPAVIPS